MGEGPRDSSRAEKQTEFYARAGMQEGATAKDGSETLRLRRGGEAGMSRIMPPARRTPSNHEDGAEGFCVLG